MYKYTKIQGPRFQRNYIIARYQKSDLHGTPFQSSPKINRILITRPLANNESLQHPTIAILLIKILIFFPPLNSVHLFQVINAFKRQNSWTDIFRKSSKFNLFLSFLRKKCVPSITQRFLIPVSGSFENEALENEDRSTKYPNLENEAPRSRKQSTQNSKTEHPNLENEAPTTRKRSTLNWKPVCPLKTRDTPLSSHQQQESSRITNRMQFKTIQVELRGVANVFPSTIGHFGVA